MLIEETSGDPFCIKEEGHRIEKIGSKGLLRRALPRDGPPDIRARSTFSAAASKGIFSRLSERWSVGRLVRLFSIMPEMEDFGCVDLEGTEILSRILSVWILSFSAA